MTTASPLSPRACRTVAADLAHRYSTVGTERTPGYALVAVVSGDTPTDVVPLVTVEGGGGFAAFAEQAAAAPASPGLRALATIVFDGHTATATVVSTCGCSHAVTVTHTKHPSGSDEPAAMLRGILGLATPRLVDILADADADA